jgi:hypothetical protein
VRNRTWFFCRLDEKEKAYQLADGEIQALNRKLVLEQDELERSESKLAATTAELNEASVR